MNKPVKQHLIDPEICIRCYSCENACTIGAILHDDNNVVVQPDKCNMCMDCIPVCPTGSIDEWRVVSSPFSIEDQFNWDELPEQGDITGAGSHTDTDMVVESLDEEIAGLLQDAHKGTGGPAIAPASAARPVINLYTASNPVTARVQGTYRLTAENAGNDVRHIILEFGGQPFPVLEGQSVGVIPPGVDGNGKPHQPRLYSVSSPRDGERANFNNVSLTVKRDRDGVCSNYLCDLERGDEVKIAGPYGSTFLMPDDPAARILMICTGTGSAPFRAFTMRRQRTIGAKGGQMVLFFGARTPDSLPYFGPLRKIPDELLQKYMAFSRIPGQPGQYVQDRLLDKEELVAKMIAHPDTHIYICGLRGMEEGVEKAFNIIAEGTGTQWAALREVMRSQGRYHVETY